MGKVDYFHVVFQDGKTTFFPGEVLNGTVNLKVNSELKLRGIRIEFHGVANVFLSAGDQRRKKPANSEVYIDLVATLYGKVSTVCFLNIFLFLFSNLLGNLLTSKSVNLYHLTVFHNKHPMFIILH